MIYPVCCTAQHNGTKLAFGSKLQTKSGYVFEVVNAENDEFMVRIRKGEKTHELIKSASPNFIINYLDGVPLIVVQGTLGFCITATVWDISFFSEKTPTLLFDSSKSGRHSVNWVVKELDDEKVIIEAWRNSRHLEFKMIERHFATEYIYLDGGNNFSEEDSK